MAIKELVGDGVLVTGVKGNAEANYRKGLVDLTPANLGALALSGGTMTGPLKWTNNDALPEMTGSGDGFYPLAITSFTNGGQTHYTSAANFRSMVGAAASSHTHNYAGSSSAGGDANRSKIWVATHTNELNFVTPQSYIWFGYRWGDETSATELIEYRFSNCKANGGWAGIKSKYLTVTTPDSSTRMRAKDWVQLVSTTGQTAKSFSLSGYNELMVVARYSSNYVGSCILPASFLTTSNYEMYLGGGKSSDSGGRRAVCTITSTKITPIVITVDGTNYTTSSSALWYVYAR